MVILVSNKSAQHIRKKKKSDVLTRNKAKPAASREATVVERVGSGLKKAIR